MSFCPIFIVLYRKSIYLFADSRSDSETRRKRTITISKTEYGDPNSSPQPMENLSYIPFLDVVGVAMELKVTDAFTWWGKFCSTYRIYVIIVSIIVAGILCIGMVKMEITTDPVELWAGAKSRSRIEKDFYDSTFRPFYRTEQIIIKAKNLDTVSFF